MAVVRPEAIGLHPTGAGTEWRAAEARLCCLARNGRRPGEESRDRPLPAKERGDAPASPAFGQTCPIEDDVGGPAKPPRVTRQRPSQPHPLATGRSPAQPPPPPAPRLPHHGGNPGTRSTTTPSSGLIVERRSGRAGGPTRPPSEQCKLASRSPPKSAVPRPRRRDAAATSDLPPTTRRPSSD